MSRDCGEAYVLIDEFNLNVYMTFIYGVKSNKYINWEIFHQFDFETISNTAKWNLFLTNIEILKYWQHLPFGTSNCTKYL